MADEDEESEILMTIPLRQLKFSRRTKRSSYAIKYIRAFIARHMKAEEKDIWVDPRINELIWRRGIQKPPSSIRVKVSTLEEEEKIGVELPSEPEGKEETEAEE